MLVQQNVQWRNEILAGTSTSEGHGEQYQQPAIAYVSRSGRIATASISFGPHSGWGGRGKGDGGEGEREREDGEGG